MSRLWWPADWADEVMPPGRPAPENFVFIDPQTGSVTLGYLAAAGDVVDGDLELNQPLVEGDVVHFICCDELGEAEICFPGDGTYRVITGSVPGEHNWCRMLWDQDTMQLSIEELARRAHEYRDAEDLRSVTVQFARWSDRLAYKLARTADVGLSFVAISQAEARQ